MTDFSILGDIREPGLYFGLSDVDYHADSSLSNSGIKNLLISPLTFWTRSRLNPDFEDKVTPSMITGKAYHKMVLEGADAFKEAYAVKPDPADYPGVLVKGDDMRAWLANRVQKTSGSNAQLAERIRALDYNVPLWSEIMAEFKKTDRIMIDAELYKNIIRAGMVLNRLPSVQKAFTGGYPEVSVFWRDKETGVPMKIRMDYVKPDKIIDLKTFSNSMGDPIENAVAKAVAAHSYHIQPPVYCDGAIQARTMLNRQGGDVLFGEVDPDWLQDFVANAHTAFYFVFLQSGPIPDILGREFCKYEVGQPGKAKTMEWDEGEFLYRWGVQQFAECVDTFGADPWIEDRAVKPFSNTDFPMWMFPARRK